MFKFFKKNNAAKTETVETKAVSNTVTILTPVEGKAIALAQVADGVFSEGMLGKGAAVLPSDGIVTMPVNGTVEAVFPTKHAYGIQSDDGVEVLVHIGIDTVEMNGEGFSTNVSQGDHLNAGDVLGSFSIEAIEAAGYVSTVIVVISNTDDFAEVTGIENTEVSSGDTLIQVVKGV